MEEHRNLFSDETTRRSCRVFKAMAGHLLSRDYNQCRSHHQKMILKFKSLDKLIKHLRKKIGQQDKAEGDDDAKKVAADPHSLISSSDTLKE